ncbi:tRNA1(Val) A37 N6-methylase TrmN6 [Bradyrhizobium sp. S3.3.6]
MTDKRDSRKCNNIVLIGAGAGALSMSVADHVDEAEALDLAKRIADQTGRTVSVRDARGAVLGKIPGSKRN